MALFINQVIEQIGLKGLQGGLLRLEEVRLGLTPRLALPRAAVIRVIGNPDGFFGDEFTIVHEDDFRQIASFQSHFGPVFQLGNSVADVGVPEAS